MVVYWITGVLLLLYLVLVWFLGSWFHLHAPDLWILRGGLALIGLVAAASFIWFYRKTKAASPGAGDGQKAGSEDIDLLVHEALGALRKSTLGRGATLRNLPLIFFVGDAGAAKTNIIIHSGLDPELLAGQVYQDSNVLPTRLVNIWYSQSAVLVDPAGNLLQQPDRWKRLVQLVRPGRASTALSKSQQAPRAAVLCFDCPSFLKPGASEATITTARKLGARLHEISQTLSISLPVYVLFTKLDRLQGFTEFARGLTPEESSQILGATLPMRSLASGVYSEEETKRLTNAFDELFFSLSDRRIDLLARENDTDGLPSIYEFPRELRKLRTLLVQFLVELARPSRLSVNPFLRGFYFSGVRPVFVEDGVSAASQPSASDAGFDGGATQVFGSLPAAAAPMRSPGRRKVPQWTFLTRLFNDVIVKDRVALAASGVSSNVNLIRRVALITATVLSFVVIVGFLVSYLGNRELENNVQAAATNLQAVHIGAHQLPSLSNLQKLDKLREELNTLATYQNLGVPWRLRWFLYVGDKIRPDARKVYFSAFRQMLFDDAQSVVLGDLHHLPDQPGPNDSNNSYETTYDELKAHLITAGHYDKSTKEIPGQLMARRWADARKVDPEIAALAQRQFEYYAAELPSGDPIGTKEDNAAVAQARAYLAKFGAIETHYHALIDRASRAAPDAIFSVKFPDATGFVSIEHPVKGAFTPAGFQVVKTAIFDPASSLATEEWVLGKTTATELNQAALQQQLMQRYQQDFVKEWRDALQRSHVAKFKDPNDADQKLGVLTGATSPLLELLWFISSNTNIDNVREPFASVEFLEPPTPADSKPDKYQQPSDTNYMQALANLQASVHILSQNTGGPSDPNASAAVTTAAAQARSAANQAIAGSKIDNAYNHTEQITQHLLEEPIINAEAVIPKTGDKLNGAGKDLCSQFNRLAGKFPLNSKLSATDLTLDEFNGFFAPKTGALWSFYDTNQLAQYLRKEGDHYVATAAGAVKLTTPFVAYFNRMAAVTDAFYPAGSPTPHFSYSLTPQPSNIQGQPILTIGNEVPLTQVGQQKKFNWTGAPENIRITAGSQTYQTYSGPWAAFRFVDAGSEALHSHTSLQWNPMLRDGQGHESPITIGDKPEFYAYQLQVQAGSPDPFAIMSAAGGRCEAHVAQ
jgi:type VI secretion system protein ImpL